MLNNRARDTLMPIVKENVITINDLMIMILMKIFIIILYVKESTRILGMIIILMISGKLVICP